MSEKTWARYPGAFPFQAGPIGENPVVHIVEYRRSDEERERLLALVLRAVNCHADLVAACKALSATEDCRVPTEREDAIVTAVRMARAAIAKTEEQKPQPETEDLLEQAYTKLIQVWPHDGDRWHNQPLLSDLCSAIARLKGEEEEDVQNRAESNAARAKEKP